MRGALAAAVGLVQLVLAYRYPGFLTGDEVEVLGTAFRTATGYEYGTWDVRNTFVADVIVAPFIRIAALAGVSDPGALIVAATIPFALASSLTILLVHRLALRWSGDAIAADAAMALFALHWLPLGFGSTTYPRVIAMVCIVAAALLVERGWMYAAGALMGVAFADRYSEIVYLLPLLLLARRRAWQVAAGALAAIALLSGVYEWMAWGSPFHSLRKFAQLTLVERDFASRVKYQSPLWYLETLPRWCALTMLPLVARAARPPVILFVAIPLLAFSLIAHKELRYLQGVIPFIAIAAGIGFAIWWPTRRKLAIALLALSLAWNLYGLRFLGRESKPAVDAARFLGANESLRTLAIGQLWAYGDRLYLGDDRRVIDIGTPPHSLDFALREADAVALYESDLTAEVSAALTRAGFVQQRVFRAPRARDVVVFVSAGRSGR